MTDTEQNIAISENDPLFGNDNARIKDTISDSNGNPKDLSTANAVEFEVFSDHIGGTSVLKKTDSDSEFTITGSNNEVAQVDLTGTETDSLAPELGLKIYKYRFRAQDSSNEWDTPTTGKFGVRAG